MAEQETVLAGLERIKAEEAAKAKAAVDERIANFKAQCLAGHLAGNTPVGEVNPDTLTEGEQRAIAAGLAGKSSKVDAADGSQDSVDVVLEYLKANKAAAESYKAAVK